jgi:TPR repeat protein
LQYKLAKAYENDHEGLTRSDESAMELYLKAANQDHAEAQVRMANYYREGFSDHKDHTNAFEWYMKAAIQGHTDGAKSVSCTSTVMVFSRTKARL